MKFLLVFAHPDDESAAAGGTVMKLVDSGNGVKIVLATAGESGKVHKSVKQDTEKKGWTIKDLRKHEFELACSLMGVEERCVCDFVDGEITNSQVWEEITNMVVEEIDSYKPDFIVTFDHSGWYYHLDHVGVSIAALRGARQAKHQVEGVLLNLFHPPGIEVKWNYVYADKLPFTHKVDITDIVQKKVEVLKLYKSQNMSLVKKLEEGKMNTEYFQAVRMTKEGEKKLANLVMFEKVI